VKLSVSSFLLALATLVAAPLAHAQNRIMMQIPGITGESQLQGFTGWIELDAVSFGVSRASPNPASQPQMSGIQVSKRGDSTSPLIFGKVVNGNELGSGGSPVRIRYLKDVASGPGLDLQPYMEIDLEDALIDSMSNYTGGEFPMESLNLQVKKFTLTTKFYNPDGSENINKRQQVSYDFIP